MSATWRNWGRTERATPRERIAPASVVELQSVVQRAAQSGRRVKAIGAGHSFTGIAVARDIQVDVRALSGLLAVDVERGTARLGAGTRLFEIPGLLAPHGLSMANLGDIDRQTVAGAISTGTHGTGLRFGGLATQVIGATLVTGEGELISVDGSANAELLPAVRLGLGALGILVDVTIQCVPAFLLRAVETPEPLDAVLESLPERIALADHFEFYWFPHTHTASTKTNTRLPAGAAPRPRQRTARWVDEVIVEGVGFRAACALAGAVAATTPAVNRLAAATFANSVSVDVSHRVFTSRRHTRFAEMEYGVPLDALVPAFGAVRDLIARRGWRIEFPVEVRTAAADENWLSTAYGRETGYIAVHRYYRRDHGEYFREVEAIMREFGGRPHWGKLHYLDAAALADRYPRFEDFCAVRDRLDPRRTFANEYLGRVLGP